MATFRDECARVGRPYDPMMVGVTCGLQIVEGEAERRQALAVRAEVLRNIGGLARGPGAARCSNLKEQSGPPVELDDAPLLGTPDEIVARLKRLEAGGVGYVLLVEPRAAVASLRRFAAGVMPAFAAADAAGRRGPANWGGGTGRPGRC